jgi:hypothetical protein
MEKNKTDDMKFLNTKLENCPSAYYSAIENDITVQLKEEHYQLRRAFEFISPIITI